MGIVAIALIALLVLFGAAHLSAAVVAMLGGAQWLSIAAAAAVFVVAIFWHIAGERRRAGSSSSGKTSSGERWVYRSLALGLSVAIGLAAWQGRDVLTAMRSHSDWMMPGSDGAAPNEGCARLAETAREAYATSFYRSSPPHAGLMAGAVHYMCVAHQYASEEIKCVEDEFRRGLTSPEMQSLLTKCGIDKDREARLDGIAAPECSVIADRIVARSRASHPLEDKDPETAEAVFEGIRLNTRIPCERSWTHEMKVCAGIMYRHSQLATLCELPPSSGDEVPNLPRKPRDLTNATGGACATAGPRWAGFYLCSTKKWCDKRREQALARNEEVGECVESEVWCVDDNMRVCGPSKKACDHVRNVFAKGDTSRLASMPECELVDLTKLSREFR